MQYSSGSGGIPSALQFDPSLYPRTYRTSLGNRIFLLSIGGLVGAGGLLGMIYFGTGHEMRSPGEKTVFALLSLVFFLLALYLVLYTFKSKLILHADRVEWHDVFTTRSLLRNQIGAWRIVQTQYVSTLEFIPQDKGAKKLKVGLTFNMDDAFQMWLEGLPNLDVVEREKSAANILEDPTVGATLEDRSQLLAAAKKKSSVLTWIAGIVAAWGFFYPRPYGLAMAVLAVVPLIAVALLTTGGPLYQIEGRRNDARADLSLAFLAPGIVLGLRSILDFELLEWTPILKLTFAGSVLLTIFLVSVDRGMRQRKWAFLAFLFLSFFYVFGAVAQANTLFDHSQGQTFKVRVLGKRFSSGKSTTYYLQVEPWGPRTEVNEVSVRSALYRSVAVGQDVCISLWQGALRVPWFIVRPCR